MTRWNDLAEVAARQYGLVTLTDARACGIAETTLGRRAREEGWESRYRGVWALPGASPSPHQQLLAAILAVGPPAWLGRRSAAWLWGITDRRPDIPEVLLPADRATPRHPGLVVVRSRTLTEDDGAQHEHLPVTRPARTLLDLAGVLPDTSLLRAMIAARQKRLVELPELAAVAGRCGNVRGVPRFRRAVETIAPGQVDSMLELEIRQTIALAGLPPPHPSPWPIQTRSGQRLLDIAWPERLVAIEADGFAWHHTHEDLVRDHAKQNESAVLGWTVLRVGYWRWRNDAKGFMADLRALLSTHPADA